MTVEEFDSTAFGANMEMKYRGVKYPIVSVDFEERLLAYPCDNFQELSWVRCENVTLCSLATQGDGER